MAHMVMICGLDYAHGHIENSVFQTMCRCDDRWIVADAIICEFGQIHDILTEWVNIIIWDRFQEGLWISNTHTVIIKYNGNAANVMLSC